MAKGNDGHPMTTYPQWPGSTKGQDQKYFKLGHSKAKPGKDYEKDSKTPVRELVRRKRRKVSPD